MCDRDTAHDQLEFVARLVGGTSWISEALVERVPSREFCLPPSVVAAPRAAPRSLPSDGQTQALDEEGERGNP
jgi:hypothetical protein